MTLLTIAQLGDKLDSAKHDLFRWETLPAYEVASDGSDYRRYLDGAPEPTWERKQPWLDTLRAWAEQGRERRRVRIIHDPITDYEKYSCQWGYELNSKAGELIRVIDLSQTPGLPDELTRIIGDFWLIDGHTPVVMHYAPDGQFRYAETVQAQYNGLYRAAATAAWRIGHDFTTWWNANPQHHRSAHRAA